MASTVSIPLSSAAPVAPVAPVTGGRPDGATLTAGQMLEAVVLNLQADGAALLAIKGQAMTLLLNATLASGVTVQPGQSVALKVLTGETVANGATVPARLQVLGSGEPIATAGNALAAGVSAGSGGPGQAAVTAAPAQTVADILRGAIASAVTVQNSAAPLYANLAALQQRSLPPALRGIVDRLLAARVAPDDPDLPKNLARAVRDSGLFMEAQLAEGEPGGADDDIKTLLLSLKSELETLDPSPLAAPSEARARPPLRGEAPLGQPAAEASLDPEAPLGKIAAVLRPETEAAIARLELAQYASINGPENGQTIARDTPQWTFELPIALGPQQTAIAQFQLVHERPEQEEEGGGSETAQRSWKIRFSIETSEDGPVQAQVGLRAGMVSVFLSADRPETAQRFQQTLPDLVSALQAAALDLETVLCLTAVPRPVSTPAGSLMNVST